VHTVIRDSIETETTLNKYTSIKASSEFNIGTGKQKMEDLLFHSVTSILFPVIIFRLM
jgi:hypothetical protein